MLLDQPPDHLRVVGFLDEVELVPQVRFELFGERLELEQLRRLRVALEQLRRRAEHLEVELDLLDDPGPAHLDDDAATRLQQGRMDLGDRRGGERLGVDLGERLEPEVLRDHGLDQRVGHRLDLVDELAELLDVDVRKQVGARGEQLPELDVRGAELLERAAKLDRALAGGRLVADDADLGEHAQEARPPRDARHLERAPPAAGAGSHRRGVSCLGYVRNRRTAASSSRSETAPSNFALILPSRPTRNTHGSVGSFHSWTHRFTPSAGLFSS